MESRERSQLPPSIRKVWREQGMLFGKGNKMRGVLTPLHQRNGVRREKKNSCGSWKKQKYAAHVWCQEGDATRTNTPSDRAVNHVQTGAGRDCICHGLLKGHCNSQDTRHQAETINLGLQTSRKHVLKGSSEGVQQGFDIAGGTVSSWVQKDVW